MFTVDERNALRTELLQLAAAEPRISGTAVTGSAAAGSEDAWSDIDLAFGVVDAGDLPNVLADFTARMYENHRALHHVDVRAGAWIYRVFLLPNTLQVDLAFVPASEFRALTPTFRLVSGEAREPAHIPAPPAAQLIGMAWLFALHARSSIARQKLWQAEYMISGVRDHGLALACIRHNLPAVHGRGLDLLPPEVTERFETSLVRELKTDELARAFRDTVKGLIAEIQEADPILAAHLGPALAGMTTANDEYGLA